VSGFIPTFFRKPEHWLLWFLWLLTGASLARGESLASPVSLPVGTVLEYGLSWGVIGVGKARLEVLPPLDGQPGYRIDIRTNWYADVFYKVRTRIECRVTPDFRRSTVYRKKQREGDSERDIDLDFRWDKREVVYRNRDEIWEPVPLPESCLDPMGIVFAVRHFLFSEQWPLVLPVTDGKKVVEAEVHRMEEEVLRTSAGSFPSYKLDAVTKDIGGIFNKSDDASLYVWFSKDARGLILRLQSKVAVGSFVAELDKVEWGQDL